MRPHFTGLWRNADFLKLWTGQTISVFGSMIGGSAMTFTAIIFLHATPLEMAILSAARQVPAFVAGLMAGVWVDRLRRRPILITTDLGRALLLATIPLAAAFGALRIEHLYVVAFGTSLLTLLFDVAYQAYLPALVQREEVLEGNSKLTASASVAEFGGFSLAGWLVQWLSGPATILIDALSFVVSAVSLAFIRRREPAGAPTAAQEPSGVWREIVDGLRVIRRNSVLLAIGITEVLLGIGQGIVGAIISLFMIDGLHFEPGVLGMIWAVGGVTSFLGATFAAAAARRWGAGGAMSGGLLFSGLGTLLVPLAPGPTLLGALLLVGNQVITDPAHTVYLVNEVSLRQRIVPGRLLGRVSATVRFGSLGATLVGAVAGGVLGERTGLRPTLVAGCGLTLAAALWLRLSPAGRLGPPPGRED